MFGIYKCIKGARIWDLSTQFWHERVLEMEKLLFKTSNTYNGRGSS